jgi:PAS domain S-box-containing protein
VPDTVAPAPAPLKLLLIAAGDALTALVCETRSHDAVECVPTLAAALERCAAARFDCLLGADPLPDGDIATLLAQLQRRHDGSLPPVVVIVSDSDRAAHARALRAGAHEVIAVEGLTGSALARAIDGARERVAMSSEGREHERTARDSEQFLRRVLDSLFAFVGVLDRDGTLLEANRAPLEAAGLAPRDVIGRKFWDCWWWSYSAESQARVRGWIDAALRGEVVRTDVQVRMAGGYMMWIDFQLAPLRDASGRITHLVPSAMDLTDRRRAEAALRRSEQIYRRLADANLVGVGFGDSRGNVHYVNDEMLRMMGYTRADFDAGRVQWTQALAPESREEAMRSHPQFLADGQHIGYEREFQRPDGGRTPFVGAAALLSPDDDFHVSVALDLTRIREAEAALRRQNEALAAANRQLEESLALLDTVFDKAPIGLTFMDPDFRYVRINESLASLNGRPAADHIGRTPRELLPDVWAHVAPYMEHVRATGEAVANVEVRAPIPGRAEEDGCWLASYYPIHVRGSLFGYGIVALDATAQKRAELALREADRRKDEFLATLAHELRNPLAPIRTGLQVLGMSADPLITRRTLEMMDRQVTHMVRLIDDLLDVSRITRGKLALRHERVALRTVIEQAVEACLPLLEASGHELSLALPEAGVPLDADPVRMAQVFSNLINNAAKYTERGGRIAVVATHHGDRVEVSVRDSGIGIAAENLERVFEMFSQVTGALERSQGGLGIGLALTRGLVAMHGGTIRATSAGIGHGSEFTVTLPVASAAPTVAVEAPPATMRAIADGMRVLVVDDNQDAAEALATLLRLRGADVRTVFDGQTAHSVAATWSPHTAFVDLGMPRMNGYELCRALRAQDRGQETLLVAMTGWGQEHDRRRSREAGFDHHLVKPATGEDIDAVLAARDIAC